MTRGAMEAQEMVPTASFALNALSPSCNAVGFFPFFGDKSLKKGRSINTGHNAANQSVVSCYTNW